MQEENNKFSLLKKISLRTCLIIGIALELMAMVAIANSSSFTRKAVKDDAVFIGISVYSGDDTFVNSICAEIDSLLNESQYKGIRVRYEMVDAGQSQLIQNRQVEKFVSLKYNAICVNPVERTEVSTIIDRAVEADIPLIFFNREPVKSDINRSKNIYYIGSDSKDAAIQQADMISQLYASDPASLDLNNDGMVTYVILEGEANHQDTLIRTEWVIKNLQDKNVPVHKIAAASANWDRNQASVIMEDWLTKYADNIELVIANNDDMALGAADAIERCHDTRGVKIFGMDGSNEAIKAVDEGKIYGTVKCDFSEYARLILDIAVDNAVQGNISNESSKKLIQDKYAYIKYSAYNKTSP